MKASTVVYTVVFQDYDSIVAVPRSIRARVHAIAFTDKETRVPWGWERIVVADTVEDARAANRSLKFRGHPALDDFDRALYIDGNIVMRGDVPGKIDEWLRNHPLAFRLHPTRVCLYDEIEVCVRFGLISESEGRAHAALLEERGFPRSYGLFGHSIFAVDLRSREARSILTRVAASVERGPIRDQLHLMPLLWETGFRVERVPYETYAGHFRKLQHRHRLGGVRRVINDGFARTYHHPHGAWIEALYRRLHRV